MSLSPDRRRLIQAVQAAALGAVEPGQAVRQHVRRTGDTLVIQDRRYDLNRFDNVWIIGGGKAAAPMVAALVDILRDRLAGGAALTKYGHVLGARVPPSVHLIEAGHPIPDDAGVAGARQLADLASRAGPDDLVLCPISGGGSALMTLPVEGVALSDLQLLTDQLLRCGATINELNTVRKHLSQVKGGGLARMAAPAAVVSLILSDVVGDPLDVIASGPTTPDSSTFGDAWAVLERHGLLQSAPPSVLAHLQRGREGLIPDTPKPGDPVFAHVQNVIVGSNRLAAEAAVRVAEAHGLNALLLSTFVEGEAREVARVAAALAKEIARYDRPLARPACVVWGGETTVTMEAGGLGGRNQELALSAALSVDGWPDVALLALATDGTDGPTDAAGALVTGETVARARRLGLDPAGYLARHDSYPFFQALGDLVITGPTRTNVNDLLFIFVFPADHSAGVESAR